MGAAGAALLYLENAVGQPGGKDGIRPRTLNYTTHLQNPMWYPPFTLTCWPVM